MTTWRALIKYIHGVNLIITGNRNWLSFSLSLRSISCDYGWCEMMRENCVQLYLFSFLCLITFLYQLHLPMWNNLSGVTVSHLQRPSCFSSLSKQINRKDTKGTSALALLHSSEPQQLILSLSRCLHSSPQESSALSRQQHLFGSLGLRVTFPPAKQSPDNWCSRQTQTSLI